MGIIGGANPYINTYDPVTGTRIHRFRLSATIGIACYPACDGRCVLITRRTTQTVTPLYLETQTFGKTISIGTNPVGIVYDGRFLWNISSAGALGHVDLATGTTIETASLTASSYLGLTHDKRFIWTIDVTNSLVQQVDPSTGTIVGGFTMPSNAKDLHHDGRFLWILTGAGSVQGVIRQYDPTTGTECGAFNITNYGTTDTPTGITGDGRFIYHTELIV